MKSKRIAQFLSGWILGGMLSTSVFAQQGADSLLPLKRIFFKPFICGTRPSDPNVSPDGRLILFRWDSTANNKYRSWLMRADGSNLHQISDTLLGELAWSPDSKTIACTRKGDLFLTDTGFHTFERLTKTEASENSISFSPDGKYLAFSSEDKLMALPVNTHGVVDLVKSSSKDASVSLVDFTPDSRTIVFTESDREGLKEFVVPRYTGKEVSTRSFKSGVSKFRIGIAPIDTGAIVWVKLPGDQPASGAAGERFFQGDVAIAPDGKNILIERFSSNRKKREIFVADTDSGKANLIYSESDKAWVEGGLASTRWMPDGKQILTTSEKEGWNHLYVMTPEGKNVSRVTEGDWEIHWFDVDPDKPAKRIYFLANKDDHHQWQLYSFDMESKEVTRISREAGTYDSPVMAKDGSFLVAKHSNFGMPDELVRVPTRPLPRLAVTSPVTSSDGLPVKVESEIQLTRSIPDEFKKVNWIVPEIVSFKSKDGTVVPAMVYKPRDFNPAKKYPVVVFVHGAGYLQNVYRGWSYYYREYLFHHRLTQRGYVVFEVDYRGSAGYGRDFRSDVYMHLGGKDLQDELDGLEYLKSLGYIDPGRVGIYGGSYGGFMVLMGLFLSDKYECGAALRAVTSWENYYRHNSWYTEARLGKPEVDSEAYRISSPLTFADSLKKPLLILHGMVDDNVFFQDAAQLMNKLQKSGKKFETMMYPDEAHSFTEPESWFDEYSRIEEFFDRYLLADGKK